MYILSYQENSDAACISSVAPYAERNECYEKMKDEYETLKNKLNIRDEDLQPAVNDDAYVQIRLSCDEAYIRNGIDDYRWEMIHEPDFVSTKDLFIVQGVFHDLENGNVFHHTPVLCQGKEEAIRELRQMFEGTLQEMGLEENDACDEAGNAIPGGCISGTEAVIYAHAEYAMGCLVEVASYTVVSINFNEPIADYEVQPDIRYEK